MSELFSLQLERSKFQSCLTPLPFSGDINPIATAQRKATRPVLEISCAEQDAYEIDFFTEPGILEMKNAESKAAFSLIVKS
jgi:hypothetical protein